MEEEYGERWELYIALNPEAISHTTQHGNECAETASSSKWPFWLIWIWNWVSDSQCWCVDQSPEKAYLFVAEELVVVVVILAMAMEWKSLISFWFGPNWVVLCLCSCCAQTRTILVFGKIRFLAECMYVFVTNVVLCILNVFLCSQLVSVSNRHCNLGSRVMDAALFFSREYLVI